MSDKTVNGTYGDVKFENGKASFALTNDQSRTFEGLLAGVKYTVTETDADTDGFKTSWSGNTSGIIEKDTIAEVTCTNTKTPAI